MIYNWMKLNLMSQKKMQKKFGKKYLYIYQYIHFSNQIEKIVTQITKYKIH